MTSLSDQQKQLLFDYSLGLASDREAAEAEKLLSWSEEAIELHRTFQQTLAPLDTVEWDPCPDELTERLFERLREAARAGREAKLAFKAHPHMLRHACGYALANKGHDTRALQAYLGHRNIQHTVRYTELSPTRFKDFWRA